MKKIKLNLDKFSYNIVIGSGDIRTLSERVKSFKINGPIAIVTDNVVSIKTKTIMDRALKSLSNDIFYVVVPASEKSKSIETFSETINKISKKTKNHKPLIIALGGGVVGDLAGFIAATYRRGVPFIQIPTTLLAQVDSSIGGKVAIDLPEGKNLIGSFYQPKEVIIDPDFLKTLPKRQIINGMAEVIKYGIISDKSFFEYLEDNIQKALSLNNKVIEHIIYKCAKAKAMVVERDEFDEKDIRIKLNFGHTLGHAIETASAYSGEYNHGESVAIGMILASDIALRLDMLKMKDFIRIKNLIKKAGLPTMCKGVSLNEIKKSYGYDKKFIKGTNRFVLPRKIGKVEVVEDIPDILIGTVLKDYVKK